jgi:hypothetical protein
MNQNINSMEQLLEYLDDKFSSTHEVQGRFKRWALHDFEFFGCSYGFDLLLKEGVFKIIQLLDSGYNTGEVLVETTDANVIWKWAQCFSPTKNSYKTQRK